MWRGQLQLSTSPPKLPTPERRRVDQPHVLDLLELGQGEEEPAVELRELAARAGLLLARGDQRLLLRLDRPEAREVVGAPGGTAASTSLVTSRKRARDLDAEGPRLLLVGAGAREVAVLRQVRLRRRVLLQDADRAVVVRDQQALGRDEAARAAGQLHGVGEQAAARLLVPQRARAAGRSPGPSPRPAPAPAPAGASTCPPPASTGAARRNSEERRGRGDPHRCPPCHHLCHCLSTSSAGLPRGL